MKRIKSDNFIIKSLIPEETQHIKLLYAIREKKLWVFNRLINTISKVRNITDNNDLSIAHYAIEWGELFVISKLYEKEVNFLNVLSDEMRIQSHVNEYLRHIYANKLFELVSSQQFFLLQDTYSKYSKYWRVSSVRNGNNDTLLHVAVSSGNLDIVKFIYFQDATLASSMNSEGLTPTTLASVICNLDIINFFHVNQAVDETLRLAVKYSLKDKLRSICSANQNIDIKDTYHNTPLHYAVVDNNLLMVNFLIEECKANVNTKNIYGMTPLGEATTRGYEDIATILRDKKAFLNNSCDADQVILQERRNYFQSLEILCKCLNQLIGSDLCQFYHTSYNSNLLYLCSIHDYVSQPLKELHNQLKSIVYEKDYGPIQYAITSKKCKIISQCHRKSQSELFISPYLNNYNVVNLTCVPFYHNIQLLGVFFCYSTQDVVLTPENHRQILSIIQAVSELDVVTIFRLLGTREGSIKEILSKPIIMARLNSMIKKCYEIDSYLFHQSILDIIEILHHTSRNNLSEEIYEEMIYLVSFYAKATLPQYPSIQVYSSTTALLKELKIPTDYYLRRTSPVLVKLRELAQLFSVSISCNKIKQPKPLTRFDLFEIIGDHSYNHEILDFLNSTILGGDDIMNIDFIKQLNGKLGNDDQLRNKTVTGVNGNTFRCFMPYEEIQEAYEYLKNICNTNDVKSAYIFCRCMLEYIHPFVDGNGRTFRLVFNIYLRRSGSNKIMDSGKKFLVASDYNGILHSKV